MKSKNEYSKEEPEDNNMLYVKSENGLELEIDCSDEMIEMIDDLEKDGITLNAIFELHLKDHFKKEVV